MKPTHICPAFCHRCPNYGMAVVAYHGCEIRNFNLANCRCLGIVCGCGRKAEARCTWPIEAMMPTVARDLLHGDVCANLSNTRVGTIIEIEPVESLANPNLLEFTIGRHGKHPGVRHSRIDHYQWDLTARVLVRRQGACGEPACNRHIRDLDGGKYICSNHWPAQLAAIA